MEFHLNMDQFLVISSMLPHRYSLFSEEREQIEKKRFMAEGGGEISIKNINDYDLFNRASRQNKNPISQTKFTQESQPKNQKPSEELVSCWNLLQKIRKHEQTDIFVKQFDQKTTQFYSEVVKNHMDFNIIEQKINNQQYKSMAQFNDDMNLIWKNAIAYFEKYNQDSLPKVKEIYLFYEKQYQQAKSTPLESKLIKMQKKVDKITRDIKEQALTTGRLYHKESKKTKLLGVDRQITYDEKLKLICDIRKLPTEYLRGIWELITEQSLESENCQPNLEFNLDNLTNRKCRELEKYVRLKFSYLEKSKRKRMKKINKEIQAKNNEDKTKKEEFKENENDPSRKDSKQSVGKSSKNKNGPQKLLDFDTLEQLMHLPTDSSYPTGSEESVNEQ